jgi:hypothetical protein
MLLASACAAQKTASKENFKIAINNYLSQTSACVTHSRYGEEKIEFETANKFHPDRKYEKETYLAKILLILIQNGLYDGQEEKGFGNVTNKYQITEKGKKVLWAKSVSKENNYGYKYRLACAATLEVDEIQNFTEPSNLMGRTISEVTYTAKVKSEEPWIQDIRSKESEFYGGIINSRKFSASTTVVLMNDGWKDSRAK